MDARPSLLFYCQHSLGMGHLVRSFALAAALADRFQVVLLNGGRLPLGYPTPAGVQIIHMPPLGMGESSELISQDERYTVAQAKALRREQLLASLQEVQPAVVLIELFPFGRKKFAGELLPLLRAARRQGEQRPLVLCSLRDIMVGSRKDQARHDERASWLANRYFDGILMHSDPAFARLEESFAPRRPLEIPVHYTGFVAKLRPAERSAPREPEILVSAGGGIAGAPLFRAALDAHRILWREERIPMGIVAGPFLPEADFRELEQAAGAEEGLRVRRSVPDLGAEFNRVRACVSQCGYNTAMDILNTGVASLVVPFAEGREDEQSNRARRLERLGLVSVLEPDRLDGAELAARIRELLHFRPASVRLDLNGAHNSTERIVAMLDARRERTAPGESTVLCGSVA